MNFKTTLAALAISAASLPVLAQTAAHDPNATPGIDQRIVNQEKRIEQGERSGALTTHEAARLEKGESKILADEAKAKSDGVVTKTERKHLQRELSHESRVIHHEKHDRQHR